MKFISTAIGWFNRGDVTRSFFMQQTRTFTRTYSSVMTSNLLPDIMAAPAADQRILHEGTEYTTIKEGLAHILIPAEASKIPQTSPKGENQVQSVFYNPIQQFNRDLSVLAIKAYGEELLEKRQKNSNKNREKLVAKRKEKKRKREDDGLGEISRKAGKLDEKDTEVAQLAVEPVQPAVSESHKDIGEQAKPAEDSTTNGDPVQAAPASLDATTGKQIADQSTQNDKQPPNPASIPRAQDFTILDALSATGLRALRYVHEIPFTTSVTANDLLPDATKTIKLNIKHNKLDGKIQAVTGNALAHMYNVACGEAKDNSNPPKPRAKYDVIDLDPYGTAAPFLDAAVQSVKEDGGLLCVTCTDAGVWASNGYPEKAFSLYGGIPIKGQHSHEGGLRLILHAVASSAARYGLAMEPLLSLSIDFYARVFVRIYKSPADVKFLAGRTMAVYSCDSGCGAWTTQMLAKNKIAENKSGKGHFWKHVMALGPAVSENCEHCGMKTHMAGPMYAGPLHCPEFIKRILDGLPNVSRETYQTWDRIEGMLSTAMEEILPATEEDSKSPTVTSKTKKYDPAVIDHFPFFFIPSALAKVIHCVTPHENALRGAFRHLGYRVTRSHTKGGAIKTDAPWEVIWEVMREWVKQKQPIKDGAVRNGTAGYKILKLGESATTTKGGNGTMAGEGSAAGTSRENSTESTKIKVVFDEVLGKEKDAKKLVRYQLNPRENWGPMNRAKGSG